MTPPDGPGAPPGAPPPPPYPPELAVPAPAPAPSPAPAAVPPRRRRNPLTMLLIGLGIGIIVGGVGGYFVFNGKSVSISNQPQPTASASASAVATATPAPATVAPLQTPVSAPQGVVTCPPSTPTGQHQLGSPGTGQSQATALDFCGGGDAVIPPGTARFTTNNNWGLGIADSCPVGSSGESGMNTVLTVTEVIPGGGQGPDTATEPGDWVEGSTVSMATGGNYQLSVTTDSPSCVWQITIYPT